MTSQKDVDEKWNGIDIAILAAFSVGILYQWAQHIRFLLADWSAIPSSGRRGSLVFGILYGMPWIAYCVQAIRKKWSTTYASPLILMYILLSWALDSFTAVIRQCCQAIGR